MESGRAERSSLKTAADKVRRESRAALDAYGEYLYDRTPIGGPHAADWIEALPDRLKELRGIEGGYDKH